MTKSREEKIAAHLAAIEQLKAEQERADAMKKIVDTVGLARCEAVEKLYEIFEVERINRDPREEKRAAALVEKIDGELDRVKVGAQSIYDDRNDLLELVARVFSVGEQDPKERRKIARAKLEERR